MNSYQKLEFMRALESRRIAHKLLNDELMMMCPRCSPIHENKRLTLSINIDSDRWHCWRCAELRGRREHIGRLLSILRMESLVPVFDSDVMIVEDDSVEKLRHRLLFGVEPEVKVREKLTLPQGYRTDWQTTMAGRALLNYLMKVRRLSPAIIFEKRIGYVAAGKYTGCVVLPVYMGNVLRFWQVRRVMFTGNAPKYDSPSIERSGILYGYESVVPTNVIVVEGIFDKLAMGGSSVALLGKEITEQQIALLQAKSVQTATVLLDGDAWKYAKRMAHTLVHKLWGVKEVVAVRLPVGKDPGALGPRSFKQPLQVLRLRP